VGIAVLNPAAVRPQSTGETVGNDEYRSLQAQVKEAEAALAAGPGAAVETETAG